MLSEWTKYAINLSYGEPSIYNKLRELFINYISSLDQTFHHYEKLIDFRIEQDKDLTETIEDGKIVRALPVLTRSKGYRLSRCSINKLCKPVT